MSLGQPTNDPSEFAIRAEIIAIRQSRRYLKSNDGVLARILNAYKAADARGDSMGYLADQ